MNEWRWRDFTTAHEWDEMKGTLMRIKQEQMELAIRTSEKGDLGDIKYQAGVVAGVDKVIDWMNRREAHANAIE